MEDLIAIFTRYSRRRRDRTRFWVGGRPDVRQGQLIKELATRIGYPTVQEGVATLARLRSINRVEAADIMATCATGLAYPARKRQTLELDIKRALKALADDAQYFTNVELSEGDISDMDNLSTSTFDAGVIGFDDHNAFIFWVEDED